MLKEIKNPESHLFEHQLNLTHKSIQSSIDFCINGGRGMPYYIKPIPKIVRQKKDTFISHWHNQIDKPLGALLFNTISSHQVHLDKANDHVLYGLRYDPGELVVHGPAYVRKINCVVAPLPVGNPKFETLAHQLMQNGEVCTLLLYSIKSLCMVDRDSNTDDFLTDTQGEYNTYVSGCIGIRLKNSVYHLFGKNFHNTSPSSTERRLYKAITELISHE